MKYTKTTILDNLKNKFTYLLMMTKKKKQKKKTITKMIYSLIQAHLY